MNEYIERKTFHKEVSLEVGCCCKKKKKKGICLLFSPRSLIIPAQSGLPITLSALLFHPLWTVWVTICTLALVIPQVQTAGSLAVHPVPRYYSS